MDTSHPDKDINRDEGRLLGEMGIKKSLLRVNNLYVHLFLYLFLNQSLYLHLYLRRYSVYLARWLGPHEASPAL